MITKEYELPSYLQTSIENMIKSWEIIDKGEKDIHWDLSWCELNADINSAEVNNIISSDFAWELREKYLRLKKQEELLDWYYEKVYVIMAHIKPSENRSVEFDEHCRKTIEEAEELRTHLMKMRQYDEVHIKPEPEERLFWRVKK